MQTRVNIPMDADTKEQADQIFAQLGVSMATAIHLFLKATIRENGIPFSLKLEPAGAQTLAAIAEGRRIAQDARVPGYTSIETLKQALEV